MNSNVRWWASAGLLCAAFSACATDPGAAETVTAASQKLTRDDTFIWHQIAGYRAQDHVQALRVDTDLIAFVGNSAPWQMTVQFYRESTGAFDDTFCSVSGRREAQAAVSYDGDVYLIGGRETDGEGTWITNTVDICDPSTGAVRTIPSAFLATERTEHRVVTIASGHKFVVAGGLTSLDGVLSSTEVFDVDTGTWSAGGNLTGPRFAQSLVRLADDTVITAGGCSNFPCTTRYALAERFNPETATWSNIRFSMIASSYAASTLLSDGRVFIFGGDAGSSFSYESTGEIYNPVTDEWTQVLNGAGSGRRNAQLVQIADGSVLMTGGEELVAGLPTPISQAIALDLTDLLWHPVTSMGDQHGAHGAILLNDGNVLVAGSNDLDAPGAIVAELTVVSTPPVPDAGVADADATDAELADGASEDATIDAGIVADFGLPVDLDASIDLGTDADVARDATTDALADAALADAALSDAAVADAARDATVIADAAAADAARDATVIADAATRDAATTDASVARDASSSADDAATSPDAGGGLAGGGCSVSSKQAGASQSLLWLVLALGAVLARTRKRGIATAALALAAAVFGSTSSAAAQDAVNLDAYRAAATPLDGFAVSRPDDFGHLRFAAQLHLDYAWNPLVYENQLGDSGSETASVVEHHLVGTLGLALGLWDRLIIYGQLPASFVMQGDSINGLPSADGARLGDPILGARVRLVGERGDIFALGLSAAVSFPLARLVDSGVSYAGETSFTFMPQLQGEFRFLADDEFEYGRLRFTLNAGARVRDGRQHIANLSIGHEFTYGAGVTFGIVKEVDLHAEVYGASTFQDFGNRESTPFEVIGGIKARPGAGFVIGAAAGTGPSRGYGSPDVRGVFTLGWAMPEAEPAQEPEPVAEVARDSDNDGILDSDDSCPNDAEDRDGFQDEDGCPDVDNDNDGVPDANDAAPNDAEDRDGFQDSDGAPDPDNDNDGVADASDRAPNEPEDRDGFQDSDGAPEPDNDSDSILDGDDQCPTAPGPAETHGCPRTIRLEEGRITILQRIEFATNSDVILERSIPVMEEVRAVLAANPQLTTIRIEGHTDDRGNDARNLSLSQRRADSVKRWLSEHGIDVSRLTAQGFGETQPIAPNNTNVGRQTNRRVEFKTESAPAAQ